jgi:hypothetical protein
MLHMSLLYPLTLEERINYEYTHFNKDLLMAALFMPVNVIAQNLPQLPQTRTISAEKQHVLPYLLPELVKLLLTLAWKNGPRQQKILHQAICRNPLATHHHP